MRVLAAVVVLGAFLSSSVLAEGLSEAERRGKEIYLRGESPSGGEVTALMGGEGGVEVPATALPCASCHGPDGLGRPEGGVTPTNITWEALTKPYGVRLESGREHPPYTSRDLKKAIAMGFDSAGNQLNTAMPRYRLSLADMGDLVAYLQKLGLDRDPGIDEDRLVLATVLPPGELGDAVAAVLEARFAELNAGGGLYGRRLELAVARAESSPAEALTQLLGRTPVFALVAPMVSGSEAAVVELVAEREVPVIGPFALEPQTGFPLNRQVFYLYAGLTGQSRALVEYVVKRTGEGGERPKAVVVHPEDERAAALAKEMAEQAEASGWTLPLRALKPGGGAALAGELEEGAFETVFFLGPDDDGGAFLAAATELGWAPEVLAPGALFARQALTAGTFPGRVLLAFPTVPEDAKPSGLEILRRLDAASPLPPVHRASQISALAAAELLIEGLKRAGRDLSRERLITALEGLYDYEIGLTRALSYGPNRRVGAFGAYVVEVKDGGLVPLEWVELRR